MFIYRTSLCNQTKPRRPVHVYTSTQSRQTRKRKPTDITENQKICCQKECLKKQTDITEDQKICCQKECLKKLLSDQDIKETREKFFKRGLIKQGKWLTNFFEISQRAANQHLTSLSSPRKYAKRHGF